MILPISPWIISHYLVQQCSCNEGVGGGSGMIAWLANASAFYCDDTIDKCARIPIYSDKKKNTCKSLLIPYYQAY